ncbi:pentraxin fusion protein-like [Xyrauchen texanus]|uniref:pentraxin fusion protein-like n=1 Tax=Xyrauchen texanus TaxID=154827 RepID=UPI002242B59F|nr:pentraxin fusion protein-like [Xyrauchen texanus]XP_051971095.1 pentraxin fusion protein-like [Xyrauchen texanus]
MEANGANVWNKMLIPAFLYFCLLSLTGEGTEVGLGGKVLLFPRKSNSSFVKLFPIKPLGLSAFTLCMRVAMKLQDGRDVILFAYRTRDHDELNVWKEIDGRVSFYIQSSSDGVLFQLPPLTNFWTHLCFTWDSVTGLAALWVDGRHNGSQEYKKGQQVHPGGTVLLGQDPDKLLDSFDAQQSFIGEMTDVNMWDYVLSGDQIMPLHFNMERAPKGNVFDWSSINYEKNGHVIVRPYDNDTLSRSGVMSQYCLSV